MKIDDKYVLEIGELILRCKKVIGNNWDSLSFVFDVGEGHTANSGFLYLGDKIIPASAGIEGEPLLLSSKIKELREQIYLQCNEKFKQTLIQMESKNNRIKIDFEFKDASRWTIKPAKIKQMREELRPKFDD